jgi:hypothetical protein
METQTTGEKSKEGFFLKRKIFNDFSFIQAMRDLSSNPLEIKLAWNVNRIIRQAQKHIDEGQAVVKAMLEKHAEKDEKGAYIQENGNFKFKDEAAFKEEYEAYGEQEIHFASYKLNIDELTGVKISPEAIGALEPVLEV